MNAKNKKTAILLVIGIMIIAITQLILHFTKLPDYLNGIFFGIGIGILIIALLSRKFKLEQ